jgi:DNA (cytosine-5)-methyltransferase 1
MKKPVALDLFAGAGGLSAGLRSAGFRVAGAVEVDARAARTYEANHRNTSVLVEDVRKVRGRDLRRLYKGRSLATLAGCAPCQGFCSLTRKWGREDERNLLVLEMARLVEELQPQTVIMENVGGLALQGRHLLDEFYRRLGRQGYLSEWRVIQMADYGIPQSRRRLVLLAGKGFAIPFPEPTHARTPEPGSSKLPWQTIAGAIKGRESPVSLKVAARAGGPRDFDWHVVRDLQPQTKARLKAAVPGKSWQEVERKLRPKCHRGTYVGFTNVYGRMTWNQPAVTITGGCTTPAKGRFGHPDRRRTTISVREAALLQTFPDDYEFATDEMDAVCEMVGNAVPPAFAEVLGTTVLKALKAHARHIMPR